MDLATALPRLVKKINADLALHGVKSASGGDYRVDMGKVESMLSMGCAECNHKGWLAPCENSYGCAPPDGFVIVQRCDNCETFDTDLDAAKAFGTAAIWQADDADTEQIQAICIPPIAK